MKSIIIYDNLCIYCNKWKQIIEKLDKKQTFNFLSIYSKKAKNILYIKNSNIKI